MGTYAVGFNLLLLFEMHLTIDRTVRIPSGEILDGEAVCFCLPQLPA